MLLLMLTENKLAGVICSAGAFNPHLVIKKNYYEVQVSR